MAQEQFPNVYKVMDEYGEDILNEMEAILVKANKRATGNLISSLDYDVEEKSGGNFELIIEYAEHGKYVQFGRSAGKKQPPMEAIEKWLKTKKYKVTKGKNIRSAAYAVARAIKKNGIKPVNFNKPIIQLKTDKEFAQAIAEAYAKDIENQLKNKSQT